MCFFRAAIKRETEQFVRAVAQKFPGQEAPVNSTHSLTHSHTHSHIHTQPTLGESPWSSVKHTDQPSKEEAAATAAGSRGTKKAPGGSSSNNPGFGGSSLEGHYAECYPGMAEEYDATYDSDEEADYTKMDMVGVVWFPWCGVCLPGVFHVYARSNIA